MPLELRYYRPETFLKQDGSLRPEPAQTLEELEQKYTRACQRLEEAMRRIREMEAPYRKTRIENGKEVSYIDYDEWERVEGSVPLYGMETEGVDDLEWEIDLKIMHMNAREAAQQK